MKLKPNFKTSLYFGMYQLLKRVFFKQFRIINWRSRLTRICILLAIFLYYESSFSQNISKEKNEQVYFGPESKGILKFALQPEFYQDKQLDLSLYDLKGQLEKSTKIQVAVGMDTIVWNILDDSIKVNSGVYKLKIIGNKHEFEKRIILDCGCIN